ncbi:MAG: DUF6164 family protein [Ghiorsea sp.]
MAALLFKLRSVEDDEAEEVRALLTEHAIDFYETTNGRWGLGYAAIWLHQDTDLSQGKELIKAYQQQRGEAARAAYEQRCQEGEQATMWDVCKERPVQVLAVLLGALVIASLTRLPFVFF